MSFKKLIFGKQYFNYSNQEKINHLEKNFVFLYVCAISLIFLLGLITFLYLDTNFSTYSISPQASPPLNKTQIDVSELSVEDQIKALDLVRQIKPFYLTNQKKITFTYNISSKYEGQINLSRGEILLGLNKNKGEIFIEYSSSRESIKETLCHELLHTYISSSSTSHLIVYDLGKYKTCF